MMSVFAKLGPSGPQVEVTGNYFRIGEVAEAMAALGIQHTVKHETDNRARLIVPVTAASRSAAHGAAQEARS